MRYPCLQPMVFEELQVCPYHMYLRLSPLFVRHYGLEVPRIIVAKADIVTTSTASASLDLYGIAFGKAEYQAYPGSRKYFVFSGSSVGGSAGAGGAGVGIDVSMFPFTPSLTDGFSLKVPSTGFASADP